MGFSPAIQQKVLNDSARHCCVCHRYKGIKMEVHHLRQEADGGPNTYENAIPLCFDCHSDAGHYNDKHPKGIKFSIPELIKARDNWYEFVRKNTLVEKLIISEHIQTSYYVLHSFEALVSILKNDFTSFNKFRKSTYLSNNFISNQWNELLHAHLIDFHNNIEQNLLIEVRQFASIEEYFTTYNNVELVDKSGFKNPYFEAHRKSIEWKEILDLINPYSYFEQLSKSGISANEFCSSILYKNVESCGEETPNYGYTEYLQIAPISFIFLGITNASIEQIKLNRLVTIDNSMDIKLPNFNLLPYEMILVPIATAINLKSIDDRSISLDHVDGDRGQDFSRVLYKTDFDKSNVIFFENKIEPEAIIYNNNEGEYKIDIHEFDYNNLYSINSYWQCGSCPHLFFLNEKGKQEYVRELLVASSNKKGIEYFQVPKHVNKIIIRELENEITYLDKININCRLEIKNKILMKGQSLMINVKPYDKIFIKGSYKPLIITKSKLNDMWLRNELIKQSNMIYNNS